MTEQELGPLGSILSQRDFPNPAYRALAQTYRHAAQAEPESGRLDVRLVAGLALPGFTHRESYRLWGMQLDGVEPPLRTTSPRFEAQRDAVTADVLQALYKGTARIELLVWQSVIDAPEPDMPAQIWHLLDLQRKYIHNLQIRLIPSVHRRRAYGLAIDRAEFRAPEDWGLPRVQIVTMCDLDTETMLPAMNLRMDEPRVDRFPVWRDTFSLDVERTMLELQRRLP